MKTEYICGSAFVALTMCGWLAYEYEINGYGLHPAICAIVGACLVAALVAFKRAYRTD